MFQPVDFLVGKICSVNHFPFEVVDCDERTRVWFRKTMGLDVMPLKFASV